MPNALAAQVCFIFFLSGVSALIFETLWFRQAWGFEGPAPPSFSRFMQAHRGF